LQNNLEISLINILTKKALILILLIGFFYTSKAQQDTINRKRLTAVVAVESIGYVGIMANLYTLWYADYPQSGFHTLNDNSSWQQLDKVGHGVTSYYVGMAGFEALRWAGASKKKSILYGGTLGLFFLTSVEVLDGFSDNWGYSWGDVGANTAGALFFVGQQLAWNEQRILLKFSFHETNHAPLNPSLLGENYIESTLKDYNGQTYWMSANIASFLGESTKFPKWLNLAVGYGGEGMIGTQNNVNFPDIERYRQYYVSLDIDLTRIKTKSNFLNTALKAFGFIKFPLPTIEFNQHGKTKLYGFYF